ncbi:hypothetical protein CRG98_042612 [Punica granatum]|uniref:cytochrome-c oxidase n=1 Tax=Punica granatum TaxID=22663 RepID=A0A2I0HZR6_PUNGR|nr:hypothetical protein CRG98_042612 [Punica granatum]
MFIAIPSFALLYSMDELVLDPAITIKAIGHQWYRTYEYSDYNSSDEQSLTFDSYTIPEDDLELGVKCDAVPGRLNQISISQAKPASGWSCREPRSKAVELIEEGARLPVEQRRGLG